MKGQTERRKWLWQHGHYYGSSYWTVSQWLSLLEKEFKVELDQRMMSAFGLISLQGLSIHQPFSGGKILRPVTDGDISLALWRLNSILNRHIGVSGPLL